jgi:hypothetical protein
MLRDCPSLRCAGPGHSCARDRRSSRTPSSTRTLVSPAAMVSVLCANACGTGPNSRFCRNGRTALYRQRPDAPAPSQTGARATHESRSLSGKPVANRLAVPTGARLLRTRVRSGHVCEGGGGAGLLQDPPTAAPRVNARCPPPPAAAYAYSASLGKKPRSQKQKA